MRGVNSFLPMEQGHSRSLKKPADYLLRDKVTEMR